MNKWFRGTNAAISSIAMIGIFIVVILFVDSMRGFQLDLTKNKMFTLSEQTITTLGNLQQDVSIRVFTNPQVGVNRDVTDLVQEYKKRSSYLSVETYDMMQQPTLARQNEVDGNGTIVIESGGKKKTIHFYEMFGAGEQGGYQFSGEDKLTHALAGLSSDEQHTVYFLSGHEEIPLERLTTLRSSMESENYTVNELQLYREGSIPNDADMLFIIGPSRDLSEQEAKLIRDYIKDGGKLFLSLGFNTNMAEEWPQLDGIMNDFGIKNQHAVALEMKQSVLFDPMTIIPDYGYHPITSKLSEYNLVTMLSLAIALDHDSEQEQWLAQPLLMTSDESYGETDLELLTQGKTTQDDLDIPGPLKLAYAVQSSEDSKPTAVILGSTSMLMDEEIGKQGNRDFAMNAVSWLQNQEESMTIRPREAEMFQQAYLTGGEANIIFWSTVVVLPVAFLLFGGWIWWRRKRG